jgi:hypothetical protein
MAVHWAGRIIGVMMITGAGVGAIAGIKGVEIGITDGQVVISTNDSRKSVDTTTTPTVQPTPTPTVTVQLPPDVQAVVATPKPQPPKANPPKQVDKYLFIQPKFEGNPDLKQPKGKYEIRLPSNWEERRGKRAMANAELFGSSEYSSSSMSRDYQGEMYLFEDGSWIKLEKTNNGVKITSSPSKADHELRIYSATSRGMMQNQVDIMVYRQNDRTKTFTVPNRLYVFSDLLR